MAVTSVYDGIRDRLSDAYNSAFPPLNAPALVNQVAREIANRGGTNYTVAFNDFDPPRVVPGSPDRPASCHIQLKNAMSALYLAGGGRLVLDPNSVYFYDPPLLPDGAPDHLQMPPNTVIQGAGNSGVAQVDPVQNTRVLWSNVPSLLLNGVAQLQPGPECSIENLNILHKDVYGNDITTLSGNCEYQKTLIDKGTAVHSGGYRPANQAKVRFCTFIGFNTSILFQRSQWANFYGNIFDSNYCVRGSTGGTPILVDNCFSQSFREANYGTEIYTQPFAAGAITNDSGNAKITLTTGYDWLYGGEISPEDDPRLRNMVGGTNTARNILLGVRDVIRVTDKIYILTNSVGDPIPYDAGMAGISGTWEVTVGVGQHFRTVLSYQDNGTGKLRMVLQGPYPPLTVNPVVWPMKMVGDATMIAILDKPFTDAIRINDQTFDFPSVNWNPLFASLTGELHLYPQARVGDPDNDAPGAFVWFETAQVDGARVNFSNVKASLVGVRTAGDFVRVTGMSYEPPRAGAANYSLPETCAVWATNDTQIIGGQSKGARISVIADNPSNEGIFVNGMHIRSSSTICQVRQGLVYINMGRNNTSTDAGNLDIWADTTKRVSIFNVDLQRVRIVNTGDFGDPYSRLISVGAAETYKLANAAEFRIVGPSGVTKIGNYLYDLTNVPKLILERQMFNLDGSNALTNGSTVFELWMQSLKGTTTPDEVPYAVLKTIAETVGASWTGKFGIDIPITGVNTNVFELTQNGMIAGVLRRTVLQLSALTAYAIGTPAYATNGRKVGEGAGSGTGVSVYWDGVSWKVYSTDTTVLA